MQKPFVHALAFAGVLGALAPQAMAAPTSLTVDGAVYTIDYTSPAPSDYRFTLHIDLTGYTGGGSYLDALAFNVSPGFTSFALLSAPDGTANWGQQGGGLGAKGCNSAGAGFECIYSLANSGRGFSITPFAAHPDDRYTFEFDGVMMSSAGVEIKADYVDANGEKMGSLVSQSLSPVPEIPEPATYALTAAGLGLLGFSARRRPNQ